jgi:DNA-binding CsgD family transcriptional regulator
MITARKQSVVIIDVPPFAFEMLDHKPLSKREIDILKRIKWTDDQIAISLFISPYTVASHWQNIRTKTGYESKQELTAYATRKGIIEWVN